QRPAADDPDALVRCREVRGRTGAAARLPQALEPGDAQLWRAAARPGQPRRRRLRRVRGQPGGRGGGETPGAPADGRAAGMDGLGPSVPDLKVAAFTGHAASELQIQKSTLETYTC